MPLIVARNPGHEAWGFCVGVVTPEAITPISGDRTKLLLVIPESNMTDVNPPDSHHRQLFGPVFLPQLHHPEFLVREVFLKLCGDDGFHQGPDALPCPPSQSSSLVMVPDARP